MAETIWKFDVSKVGIMAIINGASCCHIYIYIRRENWKLDFFLSSHVSKYGNSNEAGWEEKIRAG